MKSYFSTHVVLVVEVVAVVVVEVVHVDVLVDGVLRRVPRLGLHAVLLHRRGHHHAVLLGLCNAGQDLFPDLQKNKFVKVSDKFPNSSIFLT